ncbi:hypothetical protein [Myxosarcina sp. GI1(2024)]
MAMEFTPVAAKPVKLPDKTAKLASIAEIQANLSYYFSEIKDPRLTA